LAKNIQISDSGIEPGGGINNPQTKLTQDTLGIPVVAIGVPLVIYVKRILIEFLGENNIKTDSDLLSLVVTAKEIDFLIKDYSHIISESINRLVHSLPSEE
ncbi:GPR endopeptidase, partial [bacterium]|nr:GPR endopeptidase [bacterium]